MGNTLDYLKRQIACVVALKRVLREFSGTLTSLSVWALDVWAPAPGTLLVAQKLLPIKNRRAYFSLSHPGGVPGGGPNFTGPYF